MAVKAYKIDMPIYRQVVKLYIGNTFKEANEKVEKDYGLEKDDCHFTQGRVMTVTHKEDGYIHFLLILPSEVEASLLAHEAVHLAWDILEHVEVKVDYNNHEALTYLVGHIIDQTTEFIDKYNGNSKIKSN